MSLGFIVAVENPLTLNTHDIEYEMESKIKNLAIVIGSPGFHEYTVTKPLSNVSFGTLNLGTLKLTKVNVNKPSIVIDKVANLPNNYTSIKSNNVGGENKYGF
jgi:hypothetical protein